MASVAAKDLLRASTSLMKVSERSNAWRACLGKITRNDYLYKYPTRIMQPDGSSYMIRAEEPRQLYRLPLDINTLNEDEKRQRLAARKPKTKRIKEEFIDDNFSEDEYTKFFSVASNDDRREEGGREKSINESEPEKGKKKKRGKK